MRNCDWTEKVSLLIDGELAAGEASAVETHLSDCLACRAAREDFLLLRRRISSYQPDVSLVAQRAALQSILAAGRAENSTAGFAPVAPTSGRRSRFAALFALPRLNPGLVAASALLLVGLVVGVLMLSNNRRTQPVDVANSPQTTTAPQSATVATGNGNVANATGNGNAANVAAPAPSPNVPAVEREAQAAPTAEVVKIRPKGVGETAKGPQPKGVGGTNTGDKYKPKGATGMDLANAESAKMPREITDVPFVIPPRVDVEALEFSEAEVAANDVNDPGASAPAAPSSTARHAEQAQMLLRSFRNSSASGAADLSYERGRSQELLYQNIVLRRAAARGGDSNVEATLTQLEPILLDIANLPDKPASEDVRSIKNRMERKNIVAMLQIAARD